MRTTLSIDDRLLALAKARAHEQHQTLGQLVEDALQRYLSATRQPTTAPALPVFDRGSGFVDGVDGSSNRGLFDALDAER
jgi:hypothetical protein